MVDWLWFLSGRGAAAIHRAEVKTGVEKSVVTVGKSRCCLFFFSSSFFSLLDRTLIWLLGFLKRLFGGQLFVDLLQQNGLVFNKLKDLLLLCCHFLDSLISLGSSAFGFRQSVLCNPICRYDVIFNELFLISEHRVDFRKGDGSVVAADVGFGISIWAGLDERFRWFVSRALPEI